MINTQPTPAGLFNLEGTVLGFLGNQHKPKSLVLEVDQEQLAIQLPKELRGRVSRALQPGDCVSCVGFTAIDFQAGLITLRAYNVFPGVCDRSA